MAKVKTFPINEVGGVPDGAVATFITDCEAEFYVTVTTTFIPYPTPRLTVIVTKLDEKDASERDAVAPRQQFRPQSSRVRRGESIPKCTNNVP